MTESSTATQPLADSYLLRTIKGASARECLSSEAHAHQWFTWRLGFHLKIERPAAEQSVSRVGLDGARLHLSSSALGSELALRNVAWHIIRPTRRILPHIGRTL